MVFKKSHKKDHSKDQGIQSGLSHPGGLTSIIARIGNARVLVVGDVMLDLFVQGRATRISPEAPVPVLTIHDQSEMLGGAGNVLSNLHGLGAKAALIGLIGQDQQGQTIRELVRARGGDPQDLLADPARPTTVKTRYLAGNQQLLRTDFEKTPALSAALEKELIGRISAYLPECGAVILSDYGKGALSPALIKSVISAAARGNIPVLVDPKGHDYARYKGVYAITPNRDELALATGGLAVDSDEDIECACLSLIKKSGVRAVVATRSHDGMSVVGKDIAGEEGKALHLPARAIEVFDVSGAGDTVIAVIGAALAAGADLSAAARLANLAGGLVVAKAGTAPVLAGELTDLGRQEEARDAEKAAMQRQAQHEAAEHERAGGVQPAGAAAEEAAVAALTGAEKAAQTVRDWQRQGLKVGFTNGCFDILHRGHVEYLAQARTYCDRLVVGLNRDQSVRLLKGLQRPLHDLDSRACVLGALDAVDMVVPFGALREGEDNTAAGLVTLLRPDFYFKGGDYEVAALPEAQIIEGQGGQTVILDLCRGHSTSATIKKMRREDQAA